MSQEKPINVILIVVDQMRADKLGINDPQGFVSTPTLDMMASQGFNFTHAYSPVPSCVPARAALLTGLNQANSGRVGYEDEVVWNYDLTLPQAFRDRGYQTQCIGKMHVYPSRKRLGFDHVLLHDGYLHVDRKYDKPYGQQFAQSSDYLAFLKNARGPETDLTDLGIDCNSWEARPWTLPEHLHPTNWVVSESIKFLQRRDPTVPFFLKMSFEKPHAPLDPPPYYFDMYMKRLTEEPDLHLGNWETLAETVPSIYALKGRLKKDDQLRMLAGYYGLITHLDHQISRFLTALKEFRHDKDTIIWFVSDHGDQLGEHYLFRKGYPYQGSIHIPSFIYDPFQLLGQSHRPISELLCLQDIFPSMIDLVFDETVPVDGSSVRPLLTGQGQVWRQEIHGEHSLGEDSNQFIVTKEWKFIWYPVRDQYQLFHLASDPNETTNLIDHPEHQALIRDFKEKLAGYLRGREEGFVDNGKLRQVPLTDIRATLALAKSQNSI